MRILQASFYAALVASGVVHAQAAPVAQEDPGAFDPFAAKPSDQVPSQEQVDPTAPPAVVGVQSARTPSSTRWTKSLDLGYQGKYVPGLINAGGQNELEQNALLDAAISGSLNDSAALDARAVARHQQRKLGAVVSSPDNDVTILHGFYRRLFGGGAHKLSLGRKIVNWSSGFQWQPANLIDNGYSSREIDIADPYRYRGVNQISYELIKPEFDLATIVSNDQQAFYGGKQFAAKLGIKGAVSGSLMVAFNGHYARKYGLTADTILPWGTTFLLEAVHVDINPSRLADASHFGKTLESLSGIHGYEDIYLGLTKFIDEKRRFSVEYFHSGRGFTPSISLAPVEGKARSGVDPSIFTQRYVGRNYVYVASTNYIDAWKLQLKPSVMINTGDHSYIGSISLKRELGSSSELTLNINTFGGRTGSEFGSVTKSLSAGASYLFHFF